MKLAKILLVSLLCGVSLKAAAQDSGDKFTVTAVGDIMMGTNFPIDMLRSDGGQNLFRQSSDYIQASDIRFGNLEGPLYDGADETAGKAQGRNRYLFRTPTSYAQWLSKAGFNVLSLANNHALDFGVAGLRSTKQALQSAGIQYSSKSREDVANFEVRGIKVALIATDFYNGPRSISNSQGTLDEIRELKRRFDVVIVSSHAGAEGSASEHVQAGTEIFLGENRGDSVKFSHDAIDAGADLILMHGPHVPRAMEIYRDRLIVYSLGNFITERGISIQGPPGLAPLVRIQLEKSGRFVRGEIMSFKQTRDFGTIYDPSKGSLLKIQKLSELDFPQTMPHFDGETGRFSLRGLE
jgi:poly-gamma-glutamate capsule biosynthesis protein CapA/YwtB (metallophosphatase superfamily)